MEASQGGFQGNGIQDNMKLHESTLKRNDMTKHEKHNNIRKSQMDVTPKYYK